MRFCQLPVQAVDHDPSRPRRRQGLWEDVRWPGTPPAGDLGTLSSLCGVGAVFADFGHVERVRYGGRVATRYDPDAGLFRAVDSVMSFLGLPGG
jgi:hypothetical protein